MRNIFSQTKMYFVTKKAQDYILDKISNVDKTRLFDAKKILELIKYETLWSFTATVGGYDHTNNTISFFGYKNIDLSVAVHECLHAVSNCSVVSVGEIREKKDERVGFYNSKKFEVKNNNITRYFPFVYGKALNEAATEFYSIQILNEHGKKKKTVAGGYKKIVDIFASFFVDENEKSANKYNKAMTDEVFKFYINGNHDGLVDYLSKQFCSPKSMINKLFALMDETLNLTKFGTAPITTELENLCYEIVYQMHFNRCKQNNPDLTKSEFAKTKLIEELLKGNNLHDAFQKKCAKEHFCKKEYNYQEANGDLEKYIANLMFDVTKDSDKIAKYSTHFAKKDGINNFVFDENYIDILKNMNDIEKLENIIRTRQIIYSVFDKMDYKVFNQMISNIVEFGMPKDKELYNEAMFLLIHLPEYFAAEAYKRFKPVDIYNYIQDDSANFSFNWQRVKRIDDLKNYIYDEVESNGYVDFEVKQ